MTVTGVHPSPLETSRAEGERSDTPRLAPPTPAGTTTSPKLECYYPNVYRDGRRLEHIKEAHGLEDGPTALDNIPGLA